MEYTYRVTYKTHGKHMDILSEANLNQEDEILVTSEDENLAFYNAMTKILHVKMAPDGYSSLEDYYEKTKDDEGEFAKIRMIPMVISMLVQDLYYAKVEKVTEPITEVTE